MFTDGKPIRPTAEEIQIAVMGVTSGKYQRVSYPGYLRIYRNDAGEVVIENLEEDK